MCGIFGLVGVRQNQHSKMHRDVQLGLSHIQHRGPDGSGVWVSSDGSIGLGHVRLSVIDHDSGAQPMHSACERYVVVFNGEIYNFIELREELGAGCFFTGSDTEVILQAFIRWGERCVERFRGMFAIAIWDRQDNALFLARDRFGIKPLYWAETHNGLVFASEIKALLPFLPERSVNTAALSDYFTFQFCLGSKTLTAGVEQLPAAHFSISRVGETPVPVRYWEVHYEIDYSHTESWFSERLEELLLDSIYLHMRADVDVGAYVSGGVDSSLLALLARNTVSEKAFNVFNGRFGDGGDFDESHFAKALADENDMDFHLSDITELDFVDNIVKVIWHMDQPNAGPGAFPQYMVSKSVAQKVKVVLGGQGGDEIFGGYTRYLVAYFEQCIKGAIEGTLDNGNYIVSYNSIIPNLKALSQYKPMLQELWSDGLFGERDERYWRLVNRANTFGNIIAPDVIRDKDALEEFKSIFWGQNVGKESYFDSMTHFDFKTLLPALLHVEDRMSMAHGVEARVPFLDHPLVEFAATIPADVKFKNGELKRLLKVTFGDRLPRAITSRTDKMGFPVPLNLWLRERGLAREFIADTFNSRKARERPYLAKRLSLDEILDSQSIYGRNLWALLSLELWHQQFID